jgi:hypothetical protein
MHKYRGSHEDFDYFVIPTVPALKQQQDTIATLAELNRLGVPAAKVKVVFNQVEDDEDMPRLSIDIDVAWARQGDRIGHDCPVQPATSFMRGVEWLAATTAGK